MDSFQAQEQSITRTEARPKNEPFKISSAPVSRARVGEEGPFRCFLVVPLLLAWLERREARGEIGGLRRRRRWSRGRSWWSSWGTTRSGPITSGVPSLSSPPIPKSPPGIRFGTTLVIFIFFNFFFSIIESMSCFSMMFCNPNYVKFCEILYDLEEIRWGNCRRSRD